MEDRAKISGALESLIEDVWNWRERSGTGGRTVTVKVRYADFEQVTRSRTLPHQINSRIELATVAGELLGAVFPLREPVRLLGIAMSNFELSGDGTPSQMMFAF